ncbi:CPBP family glutamic-type intramembrane protease [Streptomyces sp. RS10V-4]|uniref:CPBP family glutamic-type intramembrane protease n=1 Tax=Streptomyces rhizoryzae TaxID=2932493 RepID=UPI0020056137|nr:CPBP family glutamic-type intramembrane protease [Streptomyces rhizoryzae]MCK7627222.1 CPBP family glutamic-type intramembrane protease [Streptomyces rhizoryzae]
MTPPEISAHDKPYRLVLRLGVLVAIASFAPLASGLLRFGALYGVHWPPRAFHLTQVGQLVAATSLFFWLSLNVIGRTGRDRCTPVRRLLFRGAAVGTGAAAIYTAMPAAGLQGVAPLVFGCAVAWLAVEECRARGLVLDRREASAGPSARAEGWAITEQTFWACGLGGGASVLLGKILSFAGVPVMDQQLAALGISSPLDLVVAVLWAAAIEDVVMVAAVTALLTAARRPPWLIYVVVCGLEVAAHAYFGISAIGMTLYACRRVWLYRRYGRLAPMIVGHIALDLFAVVNQTLPVVYRFLSAVLLVLLATLIDRWVKRAGCAPPAAREGVTSQP